MDGRACRIKVLDQTRGPRGCGFIVDEQHAMTCLHVVRFAMGGAEPRKGDKVLIQHDGQAPGEPPVPMVVEKPGSEVFDGCVLRRIDERRFLPDQTVLWEDGEARSRYIGLGMTRDYESVSLAGELGAFELGHTVQLVTADFMDTKIEAGCSGAGLFLPGGPLRGMVTEFQQDRSGKMLVGSKLAEFWPTMKPYVPAVTDTFPALRKFDLPVADLIRDVDRGAQKNRLIRCIEQHDLLAQPGFLVAEVAGVDLDLPDKCSLSLRNEAFVRILKRIAADATKGSPLIFLKFDDVYDAEYGEDTLLIALRRELDADSAKLADVRDAYLQWLAPVAVVVLIRSHQLAQLPAGIAQTWADTLAALVDPARDKPLALFVCVLREDEDVAPLLAGCADQPWAVRLPALAPVPLGDVEIWCNNNLQDRADEAKRQIRALVAAHGGVAEFRLGELDNWLSVGG